MNGAWQGRIRKAVSCVLRYVLIGVIRLAFRPKLEYESPKAKEEAFREPQVVICNHVRGMDGGVVYAMVSRKKITTLSAKDILDAEPALKYFLSFLPVIEIDRRHASLSWLRESRKLLREGSSIMIFPEGRCNRERYVRPFKPGAVLLAATAGARVLPIYHNGTYHYFFGPRFRMIIGEPYTVTPPPDGVNSETMQREADELLHRMNELELKLTGTVRKAPPGQEDT